MWKLALLTLIFNLPTQYDPPEALEPTVEDLQLEVLNLQNALDSFEVLDPDTEVLVIIEPDDEIEVEEDYYDSIE
jgi:hypothetical protein